MNDFALYLFPLFGALIGCVVVMVCSWQLRIRLQNFKGISMDDLPIAGRIEEVISAHLDKVVLLFKSQIPLISTFLSQAREDKLKNEARRELFGMVPDLLILIRSDLIVDQVVRRLWRSVTLSLMLMGALVGAAMGLIEMFLISMLM